MTLPLLHGDCYSEVASDESSVEAEVRGMDVKWSHSIRN